MRGAGRHLRVALPWLGHALAAPRARSHPLPALDWLFARARRSPATRAWRDWLLEETELGEDVLARFPAGPCVRAAWTGETPAGRWASAGPVHLLTALDHLRLAAPAPLPMDDEESAAIVADLNRQLAGEGFELHAIPGCGWLCACPDDLECGAAEPALAVGGDLREWLPAGRDARRVRAWVNEAQMILHEHPLNELRSSRGLPPVNSVWLWGFGVAGRPAGRAAATLVTDDDWLSGLWRLHGGRVAALGDHAGEGIVQDAEVARIAVTGERTVSNDDLRLATFERSLFAPLRLGVGRGLIERLSVHTGGELLDLDGRSHWRFWRRPWSRSVRTT